MHNYHNLQIWQNSMDVVQDIYEMVAMFPPTEKYGLSSQITRAAVSITSNIAEGAGRNSTKEFSHFIGIAIGSMFELETQVLIAERIGYIGNEQSKRFQTSIHNLQRMTTGFLKNIENKSNSAEHGQTT